MFISVGTLGESTYAAPEEMANSPQFTEKCDVFSLGLIVFEMATDAELKFASYKKLKDLREKGPAPSLTKDLTPELTQLVTMMMTHDPDKRPSVKQLLELPRVRLAVNRHNQLSCLLLLKETIYIKIVTDIFFFNPESMYK